MKIISGFENYAVTEDGRVYSYKSSAFLKVFDRSRKRNLSYKSVNLVYGKNGTKSLFKTVHVHTLVLEAFHGVRPPGMVCLHLDGNPANNHISNLKWGTQKENLSQRVEHGTMDVYIGENNAVSVITNEQAKFVKDNLGKMRNVDIARTIGIPPYIVQNIKSGNSWRHI